MINPRFSKVIFLLFFLTLKLFSEQNSYIIKFKPNSSKSNSIQSEFKLKQIFNITSLKKSNSTQSLNVINSINELNLYYQANLSQTEINKLYNNPEIESISKNQIYQIEQTQSNDPSISKQYGLAQVNAFKAWKLATGKGIKVAVIDTGIDWDHDDLKNQLWINPLEDINKNGKFEPWNKDSVVNGLKGDLDGLDNDGNGFADDVIGYDFVDEFTANIGDASNPDPFPKDENGHGTNVSGVIAAQNNNEIGISGLAYNAKIMTLRAFDITGNGETDDIANAIVYAATNGAKVINMSFGDGFESPIMRSAIEYANALGSIMVAASGNNSWSLPHFPSDLKEVISVAGSGENNSRFSSSNFGNQIDISAPGDKIYTTMIGNDYKTTQGTSFSSPYVAAAIAMLCEKNPNLTIEEANNILQVTANDVTKKGWTPEFGAGILDIYEALNYMKTGKIEIKKPINEELVNIDNISIFDFEAIVNFPLLDSARLEIGIGSLPSRWVPLTSIKENTNIFKYSITFSKLDLLFPKYDLTYKKIDTNMVIRLITYLKNSKTIEKRIMISLVKNNSNLTIKDLNIRNVYFNNKRSIIIGAETNYKSSFKLLYRPEKSKEPFRETNEFEKKNELHTIILNDELESNINYEGIVQAFINNSDTSFTNIIFSKGSEEFTSNGMIKKNYTLPISIINNNVTSKLYNNGLATITVNDMVNLGYGKSRIYQFDKGEFSKKDSSETGYILSGFGDSNGDGIEEIFTTGNFQNTLYQSKNQGGNPFENTLYSSGPFLKSGGSQIIDLDKDGMPELVGRNDSSYFALEFTNGSYNLAGIAKTNNRFAKLGNDKASTVGDFNDDGITDLAYLNEYGMLEIFSYQNGEFKEIFFDSTVTSFSSQYLTSADIDGDGVKELIALNSGSIPLYRYSQGNEQVWNLRIYKFRINKFDMLAEEYFYGVRAGIINKVNEFYRNGLASDDIDNDNSAEILLSLFPNVFILKWDKNKNKLEPMWTYANSLSSNFLINDFDKNGKKEFGFTTFNDVSFFEFNGTTPKVKSPTGLKGWALDTNMVYLQWNKSDDANLYEIFLVNDQNQTFDKLIETSNTSLTFTDLKNNTEYKYTIRAINTKISDSTKFSEFSYPNIAITYTHQLVAPLFITTLDSSHILQIQFDGEIPLGNIDVNNFIVKDTISNLQYVPNQVVAEMKNKATLIFANELPLNNNVKIEVKSFRDFYNSFTLSKTFDFRLNNEKSDSIILKSLEIPDISTTRSLLTLKFSEEVDNSAEITNNYEITPLGFISNINILPNDKSKVQMNLSSDISSNVKGITFTITAKNIKSINGKSITKGIGKSLSFLFSSKDLSEPYIFPSPIKLSLNNEAVFGNLTAIAKVCILNLDGNILRQLEATGGNGGMYWDLKDNNGSLLLNGVYLFKVSGVNIDGQSFESELQKFIILQ